MSHVRQQIRDAVVAALTGRAPWADRVFAGRTWPLDETEMPALLVWSLGGPSDVDAMGDDDTTMTLERDERVVVEGRVRSKNVEPEDLLDELAVIVEPLMMADSGLGALVDRRELINTERRSGVVGDAREGLIRLTYRVVYVTAAGDPTVKV